MPAPHDNPSPVAAPSTAAARQQSRMVALLGLATLACAMGVGRFAFTPLLPLMQAAGQLGLTEGAWLAGANYLGYLLGALACAAWPPPPQAAARLALVAVAVFTAAMGLSSSFTAWMCWRFLAGVASAYALVAVSAWALPTLNRLGQAQRAGWVFAGVGLGITAVGLLGLLAGVLQVLPSSLWLGLGAASAVLAAVAWRPLGAGRGTGADMAAGAATATVPVPPTQGPRGRLQPQEWRLVFCYGAFGFGYIIPATFLPAMARELVPDPAAFGWAWPLFGAVAALSTVLTATLSRPGAQRRLWQVAQMVMALGVLAPVLVPGLPMLLFGAVCVGGTFMVITMVGMMEARRLSPLRAPRLMAAMTAAFAAGQLLGPLVVVQASRFSTQATVFASAMAASALLLSSAALWARRSTGDMA
jgi:MFS family permease